MYKRYGFLLVMLCLPTVASYAGTIDVSVDTSALVGHPAGPFYLEFTLNDGSGSGDGNNTVIVDNFNFGGGAEGGAPSILGDVTGDLTSGLTFADTGSQADYLQSFTPGATLTFRITPTAIVDPGTPDWFVFSILDNGQSSVPTTSATDPSLDGSSYFLRVDISGDPPTIRTFASDTSSPLMQTPPINIAAPTATYDAGPVPEPAMTLPMAALFGLAAYLRKRSRLSA